MKEYQPRAADLRRDAPFHLFVAVYAVVAAFIASAAGAHDKMLPLSFYFGAIQGLLMAFLLVVILAAVWSLRSPAPLKAWRDSLAKWSAAAPGIALFISLSIFMGVFSSMKQVLPSMVPFYADPWLANVDAALHGSDVWRLTAAAMPQQLMAPLETVYLACWGAALIGATFAVLFLPALRRVRSQYVWTFLIIWPLLGNLFAGAFMSAGPVFYDKVTGDQRFAEMVAYLAQHSQQAWVQQFLWDSYTGVSPSGAGKGVSAFPSMHVASSVLCALVLASASRRLRWAGVAYCAVILFGSVHLGWHYAIDGYFSIVVTLLVWWAAGRYLASRNQVQTKTTGRLDAVAAGSVDTLVCPFELQENVPLHFVVQDEASSLY